MTTFERLEGCLQVLREEQQPAQYVVVTQAGNGVQHVWGPYPSSNGARSLKRWFDRQCQAEHQLDCHCTGRVHKILSADV